LNIFLTGQHGAKRPVLQGFLAVQKVSKTQIHHFVTLLSQNATVARNGRRFFASEPASAGCHRWIKQLQGQSGSLWN